MGCTSSVSGDVTPEMKKSELAMKAAVRIQKWYRRYVARLEARRRCTWNIFQTIEYAGEQDQLKLYNFFNDMLTHLSNSSETEKSNIANVLRSRLSGQEHLVEEDMELYRLTNPADVHVSSSYRGPQLSFPLTTAQLKQLLDAFKCKQLLHAHYLLELLHQVRSTLKRLGNINHVTTAMARQFTIVGDLHGKLDDLFIIFYKNGLPATDNPYLFNGDFVDRGPNSVEIAVILFSCLLLNPREVYLNRGNHEDHIMNLRYGFVKEIMMKYKNDAVKIVRLFEDVFSWLPLATVIDQKILVTHGGISDKTELSMVASVDRHRYLSILRAPATRNQKINEEEVDFEEWRMMLDILWSDPKTQYGCTANTFRGGGSYFGPDITESFLKKHKLQMLIRSHECKVEGYEYSHNGRVLTVFSASNYYEIGSNRGAYVKLGTDLRPHIIQYMATKTYEGRKLTLKQRVGLIEESAVKNLQEKFIANRSALLEGFKNHDPNNTGRIRVSIWCQVVNNTLQMNLPWRSLRSRLVNSTGDGTVLYNSTFQTLKIEKIKEENSNVTEALYRNKDSLETIFRIIDKDNSGLISMEEFQESCKILSTHIGSSISTQYVQDMAKSIDINKDGFIDFNEFLEAFRIVDIQAQNFKNQQKNRLYSESEDHAEMKEITDEVFS